MFLLMYFERINTVSSHSIITIIIVAWLLLIFFLRDGLILSIFDAHCWYCLCLFGFICWIAKVILPLYKRTNIYSMSPIMWLSHNEIHICHCWSIWIVCILALKAVMVRQIYISVILGYSFSTLLYLTTLCR
jgi:hypothetical protein